MTAPQAVAMLTTEPLKPHVEFYLRPVEDRDQSIRHGHYVAVDEEWCRITPRGGSGNLRKEKRVTPDVIERFAAEYEAWKKGVEPEPDGTSLRIWPPISPAQLETCHAMHIYTVEQLAEIPEQGIHQMAHGRALKQKARAWLESAENVGRTAEEVMTLRVRVEELEATVEELRAANQTLRSILEDKPARAPRRKQ